MVCTCNGYRVQTYLWRHRDESTVPHDSFDRVSFMTGVLLGVRSVAAHPGLTHGLDGYMDLGL